MVGSVCALAVCCVHCVCAVHSVCSVHSAHGVCTMHAVHCVLMVHTPCVLCVACALCVPLLMVHSHTALCVHTLYCDGVCAHVHCTVCPGAPVAHGPCAQPTRPSLALAPGPAACACPLTATHCPLCVGPVRCAVCDVAVRRCGWRPGSTLWLLSGLWGCHACAVLCAQWLLAAVCLWAAPARPTGGSPPPEWGCCGMAGALLAPGSTLVAAVSRV